MEVCLPHVLAVVFPSYLHEQNLRCCSHGVTRQTNDSYVALHRLQAGGDRRLRKTAAVFCQIARTTRKNKLRHPGGSHWPTTKMSQYCRMDDHAERIKLLEQTVIRLNSTIEHLSAGEMILSARLDALRKMIMESLTHLGFATPDRTPLPLAIRVMEREACHNQLAAVSDNDPRLAAVLKEMIDEVLAE